MKRTTLLFLAILMVLTIGAKPVKTRLKISNASSKSKIEYATRQIYGVTQASYDASTRILVVTYDNKKTNTSKVRAGIKKAGYVIGSFATPKSDIQQGQKSERTSTTRSKAPSPDTKSR